MRSLYDAMYAWLRRYNGKPYCREDALVPPPDSSPEGRAAYASFNAAYRGFHGWANRERFAKFDHLKFRKYSHLYDIPF